LDQFLGAGVRTFLVSCRSARQRFQKKKKKKKKPKKAGRLDS
jgi:hypothetical protein